MNNLTKTIEVISIRLDRDYYLSKKLRNKRFNLILNLLDELSTKIYLDSSNNIEDSSNNIEEKIYLLKEIDLKRKKIELKYLKSILQK